MGLGGQTDGRGLLRHSENGTEPGLQPRQPEHSCLMERWHCQRTGERRAWGRKQKKERREIGDKNDIIKEFVGVEKAGGGMAWKDKGEERKRNKVCEGIEERRKQRQIKG